MRKPVDRKWLFLRTRKMSTMLHQDTQTEKIIGQRKSYPSGNRKRKRSLRSFYFDKYTHLVGSARSMPTYPCERPRRYIFLGQFSKYKTQTSLVHILFKSFGIKHKYYRFSKDGSITYFPKPDKNLPFWKLTHIAVTIAVRLSPKIKWEASWTLKTSSLIIVEAIHL